MTQHILMKRILKQIVAIGSVGVLGSPLLVVLGHTKCGAVRATVDGNAVPRSIYQKDYYIMDNTLQVYKA